MTPRPRPSSALFTLAALATAVAALYLGREILLPVAMAIFVSFLLAPLADRLERLGLWRIPSVLAVVSVAFAVLGLLGWIVTSQLVDLSAKLPQYRENIIAKVHSVTQGSDALKGVTETIQDVTKELTSDSPEPAADQGAGGAGVEGQKSRPKPGAADDQETTDRAGTIPDSRASEFAAWAERLLKGDDGITGNGGALKVNVVSMPPSPLAQLQTWLGPLMAPLTAAGMVVVLVLFMLLQREDQRNRLIRLFGTANIHATTEALTDVVERVSRYLRMQFIINAGYGLCVGTALALIGLPNAIMFGVLSFSLRFLPYIGPWISAALPVAVSMAISNGWSQVALVVGCFVALELLVNNVAEPLLYGSSTGVSGIGVIIAAIFWTWLWGPIGLVLAMPLTVCLVVMARYIPALRFLTVMLGDQPTLTLEERIYQRMLALDEDEVRDMAEEYLQQHTPVEFYDLVLIPALRLAERDRHAGSLSEEQEQTIQEVARELIADVGGRAASEEPSHAATPEVSTVVAPPKARVLGIPLRDEADKTACLMLGQLLESDQVTLIPGAVQALTAEMVEAVQSLDVDMVIVSVLPPLTVRTSRLLCRRLRKRYPTLPIIVGFWDGLPAQEAHQLLAAKGDGEIVTTLTDAVVRARAIAHRAPTTQGNGSSQLGDAEIIGPTRRVAG